MKISSLAVVLVDMQDFFLQRIELGTRKDLISNQIKLIKYSARRRIPLVVLEYEGQGRGKTISALQLEIKKVSNVAVIRKPHNSGFRDTALHERLREWSIKKVILMGINGSGCVQDTAIGALGRGYKIITARDIIASSSERDRNLATSKKWYSKNGSFFEDTDQLLEFLEFIAK